MTAPLRLVFDVACEPERAFRVWTAEIGRWWPGDHTVTGDPELVVIESGVGGRIYERGPDGTEHDWGEVTRWEPPATLAYRWHLRQDRADATDVEISFRAAGATSTRVEIEHRGWERLGARGERLRERNHVGWDSLLPHYIRAIERGDA